MSELARRTFLQALGLSAGLPLVGLSPFSRAAGALTSQPEWMSRSPWRENLFLQGIMRPVAGEITVPDCEVIGEIPAAMRGLLIRNSPNQRFEPIGSTYHFFDGDGMVHAMRFEDGRVSYKNRWTRNRCYQLQDAAGASLWGSIMEHPLRYQHPRGEAMMKPHGAINVVWHGGRMMVLDEFGMPFMLDPRTLEGAGVLDFEGQWSGGFTAHPKLDPRTGELRVFGYFPLGKPYMRYGVIDADGTLSHNVPIDLPRPVMSHDLWITENYSVLMDVPMVFSRPRGALTGEVFKFRPGAGTRFGVIPRRGASGDVRWFEVETCMILHTLAAWEEGDTIVLIAPRFSHFDLAAGSLNPTAESYAPTPELRTHLLPVMYRWRLNLTTGRVSEEGPLHAALVEFPRINDQRWGQRTRYGYAMPAEMDGVLKYDLQSGSTAEVTQHPFGDGRYGFEPIFVPHPEARTEDHGWIVSYVWDEATDTSDLVILDARDFEADPVARVRLPQRVPMGPHGSWIPRGDLPGV